MNTLTHNCPFCQQEMSVEQFETHYTCTCRNGACRAYGVTLSPDGWVKLTPEILETYPRQYAPEVTEEIERPEAGTVTFSTEMMGRNLVLIVTGVDFEHAHNVNGGASEIEHYADSYAKRGYTVQMAVAS